MFRTKKSLSLFAVVGGVVAIVAVAAAPPPAQIVSTGTNIVGTWRLIVSGEFPDFFGLTVFHHDKTMMTVDDNPAESAGIGVWERIRGDDPANFAVTFESWVDEDLNGIADIRFQVRLTIQVDHDTLTATGAIDIYNVAGTELLMSLPPFTLEGTRMTVIPE